MVTAIIGNSFRNVKRKYYPIANSGNFFQNCGMKPMPVDKFQLAFAIWLEDYIKRKLQLKMGEFFLGVKYPGTKEHMTPDTFRQIRRFRINKSGRQVGRKLSYHDIYAVAVRLRKRPTTIIREIEQFATTPLFLQLSEKYKQKRLK